MQRIVNVLRGVAATARGEADYEPPEHAIRYAQAIYSLYRPESVSFPRLVARLVHDSIREPLPAGMRAQDRLARHALYEAGSYCLDLQLEHQPDSGLVTLIGQLADRNKPATSTADVPVWLMERKESGGQHPLQSASASFSWSTRPRATFGCASRFLRPRKRLEVSLDRLTPGHPGSAAAGENRRRQARRKPRRSASGRYERGRP